MGRRACTDEPNRRQSQSRPTRAGGNLRPGGDCTGVEDNGHTAWAAADGWLQCHSWLRGRSLRSRPRRAHRPRACPAASTIAREAQPSHTCDASVRRALVPDAAKVRPIRVRSGEGRARLGGAWLARAGGSGCVQPNGQGVGLARAGLRQHHSSVQGGALQPSVQYTRREHIAVAAGQRQKFGGAHLYRHRSGSGALARPGEGDQRWCVSARALRSRAAARTDRCNRIVRAHEAERLERIARGERHKPARLP